MNHRDDTVDEDLPDALRRAAGEARPRPGFREGLRARFAAGDLEPRVRGPEGVDVPPVAASAPEPFRPAAAPAWALPLAAAVLVAVGLALAWRGDGPSPVAVAPPAPPDPVATPTPSVERDRVAEAEARLRTIPALAWAAYDRVEVASRPVLVAEAASSLDLDALRRVCVVVGEAEAELARRFPVAAGTRGAPAIIVVAPSAAAFAAAVAPRVDPMPVPESVVALALREEGVLLLSPLALDRDEPVCETTDVAHEAVHARLHALARPGAALPLWLEEGVADVVAAACTGQALDRSWKGMLQSLRQHGLEPFAPADVLTLEVYGDVVRHARRSALCDERPDMFVPVFHGEADTLLLHLLADERPGDGALLRELLARCLAGDAPAPEDVAAALGHASAEDLFAARDRWLGVDGDGSPAAPER